MIQPLRRKECKLADAHRAARDRPCANRELDLNQEIYHGF